MRSFDEILALAVARKGSEAAVFADCPPVLDADALAAVPDAKWLEEMARGIFQTGISWQVVDAKWPGILEAFHAFEVNRVAFMPEDWFEALCTDTRVIRSAPKIRAIADNAAFIQSVARESGSFGRRIGDWPAEDFAGLLEWLKKNGARLGGNTGAYMLRRVGKESYYMSQDVVARLVAEGVVDKAPSSKKDWAAVQAAFNTWRAQSGRNLTEIGRVLAQSL